MLVIQTMSGHVVTYGVVGSNEVISIHYNNKELASATVKFDHYSTLNQIAEAIGIALDQAYENGV